MLKKLRKLLIGGKANPEKPERAAHASWETVQNRQCLVITFNGEFTETDAEKLVRYLNEQIAELEPTVTFPLICRCQHMTDYEAHARLIFQNFLQNHIKRLHSVWIVTQSSAIKYGGRLLSMFVSVPVKVINNESQIKLT